MKKFAYGALVILAFANVVLWPHILEGGDLRVTFFDVGQGDAIFIETAQGHQILIDGGPSSKIVEKVGGRLPFWDTSIDLVILTHPDADHITGLVDVLKQYNVENILWTGVQKETNIFQEWQEALVKENAKIIQAVAPQKILWSRHSSFEFMDILHPGRVINTKEVNEGSVVAKLRHYENSFLFTGDISKTTEQQLIQQETDLSARILKVPHHGSKSSNSANFLAAVAPEIAVIQVGLENRYGHPTQEALSRLGNVSVLRTDLSGDILIESDGSSITHKFE